MPHNNDAEPRTPHRSRRLATLLAAALTLVVPRAPASAGPPACAAPQPGFAYVDTDNDGCHTDGVDSDDVGPALAAGIFVAPAGTGLVVPATARVTLPRDLAASWTAPMALTIDGKVSARGAGITLTAENGAISVGGKVDAKGDASSIVANASAGDVRLGPKAQLAAGASISLDAAGDLTLGAGSQLRAKGGSINATAAGTLVVEARTKAKAGLRIGLDSLSGATIGERALLQAETDLIVLADGQVSIGDRARLSADLGGIELGGASRGGGTGTTIVTIGERAKLGGSTEVVIEALQDVSVGSRAKLTGKGDAGDGSVRLRGPRSVLLAAGANLQALDLVFASGGTVTLEDGVKLRTVDAFGSIELIGNPVVDADRAAMKTFATTISVTVDGTVTLSECKLNGVGDNGSSLDVNASGAGVCDLTGTQFNGLTVDTDDCGTVIGP